MNKKILIATATLIISIGALLTGMVLLKTDEKLVQKIDSEMVVGVPEFIPTNGGRLEISTVVVTQNFRSKNEKDFYGIDLGTTISDYRIKVVNRYYIELEKRWPITVSQDQKMVTVRTTAVLPTLPVSFDTRTIEKNTVNGWARFNKEENLSRLEKSITPKLEKISYTYVQKAADTGRPVVEKFVKTWILQNTSLSKDVEVKVIFPSDK